VIQVNYNEQLNEEGRELWNQKAEFWDNLHGDEGNRFHRELVSPAVERLLNLQAGEKVLDVACGSGVMARRLAAFGAKVTATDFSSALIERAKMRGQASSEPIQYHVVDATDENALLTLGEGQFDAIVCTMAMMDMPVIAPLYRAVSRLLSDDGRFVFANMHPAFNSNNPVFFAESADDNGTIVVTNGVKIKAYLDMPPVKGSGAPNEPTPHYYYHRPLQQILGEAFAAGLLLNGIEEPAFSKDNPEAHRMLSWYGLWQIPPVLVGRLVKG
jgi:2-polyprenyl-3-methyl-5-hydroxy-6-metoxy-1,4-benzoquinol methylase